MGANDVEVRCCGNKESYTKQNCPFVHPWLPFFCKNSAERTVICMFKMHTLYRPWSTMEWTGAFGRAQLIPSLQLWLLHEGPSMHNAMKS